MSYNILLFAFLTVDLRNFMLKALFLH